MKRKKYIAPRSQKNQMASDRVLLAGSGEITETLPSTGTYEGFAGAKHDMMTDESTETTFWKV